MWACDVPVGCISASVLHVVDRTPHSHHCTCFDETSCCLLQASNAQEEVSVLQQRVRCVGTSYLAHDLGALGSPVAFRKAIATCSPPHLVSEVQRKRA